MEVETRLIICICGFAMRRPQYVQAHKHCLEPDHCQMCTLLSIFSGMLKLRHILKDPIIYLPEHIFRCASIS